MSTVIAAIDNSAAASPVLAAAGAFASLLGSHVEALHVRENGCRPAAAVARHAGLALQEVADPTVESLCSAACRDEVSALVLGARAAPTGLRPAGHVALELITSIAKPLLVVPPQARPPFRLRRALVPLDGTRAAADALDRVADLVRNAEIEVVALHVHEAAAVPPFSDQPQHETAAWCTEFLARHVPELDTAGRLELRVGVPRESVLDVAAEVEADLIALGWSQDLSPGRAAVVREALTRSTVPVLLVPVAR
jgi:nucleotide-binding universal stress UspA family protein